MAQELRAFTMPKWGIEMAEGTLAEWMIAEGDTFKKGQLICAIESDKIANEVEADYDATALKLIAGEGDVFQVGHLIAVFGDAGTDAAAVEDFIANFKAADTAFEPDAEPEEETAPEAEPEVVAAPEPEATPAEPAFTIDESVYMSPSARKAAMAAKLDVSGITGTGKGGRITAQDIHIAMNPSPARAAGGAIDNSVSVDNDDLSSTQTAKQLAKAHDVNLSDIEGTGRHGRIRARDVMAAAAPKVRIEKFNAMRRTMAKRLTEAKQTIPHFYLNIDVEMDWLMQVRAQLNEKNGTKVSVNDFIIKACANALMDTPGVNVHVFDNEIHHIPCADMAVAVAVEGGLFTPVIRSADTKSVTDISAEMKVLGEKARTGKLTQDDYTGGSFTISNLGMFGITSFDAVINPPQGGILAVGTIQRLPREQNFGLVFRNIMQLTMSCDHRAIDGALGAKFLARLKDELEHPARLVDGI